MALCCEWPSILLHVNSKYGLHVRGKSPGPAWGIRKFGESWKACVWCVVQTWLVPEGRRFSGFVSYSHTISPIWDLGLGGMSCNWLAPNGTTFLLVPKLWLSSYVLFGWLIIKEWLLGWLVHLFIYFKLTSWDCSEHLLCRDAIYLFSFSCSFVGFLIG